GVDPVSEMVNRVGGVHERLRQRERTVPQVTVTNQVGATPDVDRQLVLAGQTQDVATPGLVGIVVATQPDKTTTSRELPQDFEHAHVRRLEAAQNGTVEQVAGNHQAIDREIVQEPQKI